MAKAKKRKAARRRPPSTLSKEHIARIKKSDELRANNPLRKGPGAKKPVDKTPKGGK